MTETITCPRCAAEVEALIYCLAAHESLCWACLHEADPEQAKRIEEQLATIRNAPPGAIHTHFMERR